MKADKRMIIVFGVTLIAVMGISSITPAFPGIIKYFGISAQQIGLLIAAFTLPGIFLTPVAGILADRFGRKLVLVPSLFLFGIAGFLCSLMRDFHSLLVLLFLEGIGASGLSSLNITLIGDFYQGEKRTTLMGYNASILSIGTAAYPAIGGLIAAFGWQYIFYLPLLAIPLGVYIFFALDTKSHIDRQNFGDYFKRVWKSINQRGVWGLFISNFLVFVLLYGSYLTYFPILMAHRMEATSVHIGLMMSVMSLVTAAVSSQLGRLNRMLKPKLLLLLGTCFYFSSMLLLFVTASWLFVVVSVVVFGLGHGLMVPSIQNLLVGFTSVKERAAFMSANSMVLRLGQTIGPLIIGAFYTFANLDGAFAGGAFVAFLIFCFVIFMLKGTDLATSGKD